MTLNTLSVLKWRWMMRRDPECFRAVALSYWHFLLTALCVVALVASGFGGWLLWSGLPVTDAVEDIRDPGAETLSREKLGDVIEKLKRREVAYQELAKTPSDISDPTE